MIYCFEQCKWLFICFLRCKIKIMQMSHYVKIYEEKDALLLPSQVITFSVVNNYGFTIRMIPTCSFICFFKTNSISLYIFTRIVSVEDVVIKSVLRYSMFLCIHIQMIACLGWIKSGSLQFIKKHLLVFLPHSLIFCAVWHSFYLSNNQNQLDISACWKPLMFKMTQALPGVH